MMGNEKFRKIAEKLIVVFLVSSLIYGVCNGIKRKKALKDYDIVTAKIVETSPTRQGFFMDVEFKYNGKMIKSDFEIRKDTLDVGDTVLIKVSKNDPEDFIELISKKR